jgi:hypothetical protein
MRKVISLSLLLLSATTLVAQRNNVGTFQFVQKKNGHTARVVFHSKVFHPAGHRVSYDRTLVTRIDGRVPLGRDGDLPTVEIKSISFYFDGKEVAVSSGLFFDCYDPSFGEDYPPIRFGDDFQSVFVFMSGGDAAGSYQVIWVLRKDGRHTRFSGACVDCGFIDFDSGFFSHLVPPPRPNKALQLTTR